MKGRGEVERGKKERKKGNKWRRQRRRVKIEED